jgi:hypothetical protein
MDCVDGILSRPAGDDKGIVGSVAADAMRGQEPEQHGRRRTVASCLRGLAIPDILLAPNK